jgi:phosphoglucosamine mutase
VVISASHNPWQDNGIKIFGADGYKLADEVELEIEDEIFSGLGNAKNVAPEVRASQAATHSSLPGDGNLRAAYINWLVASLFRADLSHLRVLVDCANGAAAPIAHEVFRQCGVSATFLCDEPDGRNINERCGALYPEVVAAAVKKANSNNHVAPYALGITFDGDADRALFADAEGNIVNGDAILLLCARAMQQRGALTGNLIVATTMSNLGLELALRDSGIRMLRAPVGDKYVLEEMRRTGAVLGGEQSGHILFRDGDATTGDGLLTALRVMTKMARAGRSLRELTQDLKVYPQTIRNVRVRVKTPLDQVPEIAGAVRAAESELDGSGRIVVRYSGTEALARVMVEAADEGQMRRLTDTVADAIQQTLGA